MDGIWDIEREEALTILPSSVDFPAEYRFTGHLPPEHTNPARTLRALNSRTAAQEASDIRRCPLLIIDGWGLPTHVDPPRGQPANAPQGIAQHTPLMPWPPANQ